MTSNTEQRPILERGAVVFMKSSSGMKGFGNAQCVSAYIPELDEVYFYGHNEGYKGYQVDKIVSSPSRDIESEATRRERSAKQEVLNNLNQGIFFESSNPKPQFVKDCIMHELDILETERLTELNPELLTKENN